ncbi:hypothetical protein PoB_004052100 [Plakobranchus ocellatus]|uniref:Uncharacterized protein n=1 Tax=Plakobranchus ocellatus TaxID=259542 RepID=A0AAV4B0I6_9GAST|nr:hypothetical protein PoB_004052100 [Plakobranchus ocellatus]
MFTTGLTKFDDGNKQLVVPQKLVNRVMQAPHINVIGGDPAAKKKTNTVSPTFGTTERDIISPFTATVPVINHPSQEHL